MQHKREMNKPTTPLKNYAKADGRQPEAYHLMASS